MPKYVNYKIGIINCTSYGIGGKCLHQAAPRKLFGCADCILCDITNDPRVKLSCKLRVERKIPDPPKSQVPKN